MIDDLLSAGSKLLLWGVMFILAFLMLMFIMQNNHDISLYFDLVKSNALHKPFVTFPVWMLSLILLIIGALIGGAVMWHHFSQLRAALAQEQHSSQRLQCDIDALKDTISKTVM